MDAPLQLIRSHRAIGGYGDFPRIPIGPHTSPLKREANAFSNMERTSIISFPGTHLILQIPGSLILKKKIRENINNEVKKKKKNVEFTINSILTNHNHAMHVCTVIEKYMVIYSSFSVFIQNHFHLFLFALYIKKTYVQNICTIIFS